MVSFDGTSETKETSIYVISVNNNNATTSFQDSDYIGYTNDQKEYYREREKEERKLYIKRDKDLRRLCLVFQNLLVLHSINQYNNFIFKYRIGRNRDNKGIRNFKKPLDFLA